LRAIADSAGVGVTYTFEADLTRNTLSVQTHRPLNASFPDAATTPQPSVVETVQLPASMPLSDAVPVLLLWGPHATWTDVELAVQFPRLSHD
jgi:hypothetical protein